MPIDPNDILAVAILLSKQNTEAPIGLLSVAPTIVFITTEYALLKQNYLQ